MTTLALTVLTAAATLIHTLPTRAQHVEPADAAPITQAPADAPPTPCEARCAGPGLADPPAAVLAEERCVEQARGARHDAAELCFLELASAWDGTLVAVRAKASATLLRAQLDARVLADAPLLPPGRLELVGVTGVFGVWNAVAGGIVVASGPQGGDGGPILLGTSAAALALGVAGGVGGYFLADALSLDEGDAQLVSTGLVWGTHLGIPLTLLIGDALKPPPEHATSLFLGSVVGAGWLGGAAAVGVTRVAHLDAGQVALLNTTGAVGSFLGAMAVANLAANDVSDTIPLALTYASGSVFGLVAGGVVASSVHVTWGEAQIATLGAGLGGTVLGLGTLGAFMVTGSPQSDALTTGVITGAASVGVLGGYISGLAMVGALRNSRNEAFWRASDGISVQPSSGVVLDRDRNAVLTVGLAAHL